MCQVGKIQQHEKAHVGTWVYLTQGCAGEVSEKSPIFFNNIEKGGQKKVRARVLSN